MQNDDIFDEFPQIDEGKAIAMALSLMADIEEDMTKRPFLVAFRNWCLGTGPAVEDPATLFEHEDLLGPWGVASPKCQVFRDAYITEFGFAVPTRALIEALAAHGPILEVGAGHGTLSHLITLSGGDVIATDINPRYMAPALQQTWGRVEQMSALDAIKTYPGRTVLCSWPTLHDDWLTHAALALAPGQRLVVIGERYGATGSHCFHDLSPDTLRPEEFLPEDAEVWNFPMLKDHVSTFRRA